MPPSANWNYPTTIRFGAGRISELADNCKAHGIHRPLLVTDSGLAHAPITLAAIESLRAAGLGVAMFSDLKPNPVESNLRDGLQAYRDGGHDGVVAFGGGRGPGTGEKKIFIFFQLITLTVFFTFLLLTGCTH